MLDNIPIFVSVRIITHTVHAAIDSNFFATKRSESKLFFLRFFLLYGLYE